MRLLNTDIPKSGKLQIEEISDSRIPKYAILSHRPTRPIERLKDTKKIYDFCGIAKLKFKHVWIDTCCIDKTSSAELSEAINSMYYWYGKVDVCWAFLNDVPPKSERERKGISLEKALSKSVWFTRGWTLQELIAPSEMLFFDTEWEFLGDRSDPQIERNRTRVPRDILSGKIGLETISVAQRMSWVAERKTERVEDRAYSLMGIFGINMPLLYGERENAFLRLQEEILRVSDDLSLFAWKSKDGRGLLAPSPAAFIDSHDVIRNSWSRPLNSPPTVTSREIHLEVHFKGVGGGIGLILLDCHRENSGQKLVGLYVRDIHFIRDTFFIMQEFTRLGMGIVPEVELQEFRSFRYPARRIYVQSGRRRGLQKPIFEDTDTFDTHSDIWSDQMLTNLILEAHRTVMDSSLSRISKEIGGMEYAWLLLTRPDVERHIKTAENPIIVFNSVELGLDSFFKMLIGREATLDADGWIKITRTAIKGGDMPMIRAIIETYPIVESGSDIGEEGLEYAAGLEDQLIANAMLDSGILSSDISLPYTARMGRPLTVALLLRRGAAVDERDISGATSLILASQNEDQSMVAMLIERGAAVDAKDKFGSTALWYADNRGNKLLAQLLRDATQKLRNRN